MISTIPTTTQGFIATSIDTSEYPGSHQFLWCHSLNRPAGP